MPIFEIPKEMQGLVKDVTKQPYWRLTDPVFVIDRDGRIIKANVAAYDLLKAQSDSITGQNINATLNISGDNPVPKVINDNNGFCKKDCDVLKRKAAVSVNSIGGNGPAGATVQVNFAVST